MNNKEKIFTNADAIRQLSNDDLEFLLCNNNCKDCDLKHLCGDKYPDGFRDWLETEYSGNLFEELTYKNMVISCCKNTGYPHKAFPSKFELWLQRVIWDYEDLIEKKRFWRNEQKEKKKMREDKVLIINDLNYETLSKIFSSDILYDTDRIIVKQKMFTDEEVEKALSEHSRYLANVYSLDDDFVSDEKPLDDRGKIIELLSDMLGYDLDDIDDMGTAIQETLLFEQMKLYGLRKFVFSSKFKSRQRYFNPEAPIVVEILE